MMITDAPPKTANREGFLVSDRIKTLETSRDGRGLRQTSWHSAYRKEIMGMMILN
jgi:hypothetical protein